MFQSIVCSRLLFLTHSFQKASLQWFHTLLGSCFFSTTSLSQLWGGWKVQKIFTFTPLYYVCGWETQRLRDGERGEKKPMNTLCTCFSAIYCKLCAWMSARGFSFFFLDISSSVRCLQAFPVGNKNAAVVLIVCVERLDCSLKGGESGSAALWCFCGLRWTCLKTSISFVPEHKSNICTAHLTTFCFNAKELGHVSFLYSSLHLFPYIYAFSPAFLRLYLPA